MRKRHWISVLVMLTLILGLASGVMAQESAETEEKVATEAEEEEEVEAEKVVAAEEEEAPAGSDASDPIWLHADDSVATGGLAGSRAGSFVYYAIEYPGDETDVNIRADFAPGDAITLMSVGFNVYGPDGLFIGEGETVGGAKELTYSADEAATWLIQVYNYGNVTIDYTIAVEGLSTAEEPAEVEEPVEAEEAEEDKEPAEEEEAVTPEPLNEEDTLVGSRAGAYATYEIAHDGEEELELTLRYAPDEVTTRQGIGMTVYGADGWSRDATIEDGVRTVNLTDAPAGTYLVQVFNYIDGWEINYTLTQ
ncbi:MAG: hypothetical protein ACLFV5_07040 [Anaerolineales bacterium]